MTGWKTHKTDRLLIRAFTQDDISDLQRIAGAPDFARMLGSVPSPWSAEQVTKWIESGRYRADKGFFRLGVCLKSNGKLIGMVGGSIEHKLLVYFIDTELWGQGYATEAGRGLLDFMFDNFAPEYLEADAFVDNPASHRVLQKLGFDKIGEGMETSAARTDKAPVFRYRLLGPPQTG